MSVRIIEAVFDGTVLRPTDITNLELDKTYPVIVEESSATEVRKSAWDILDEMRGALDMPPDWSEQHDHYLYGTPKRNAERT